MRKVGVLINLDILVEVIGVYENIIVNPNEEISGVRRLLQYQFSY